MRLPRFEYLALPSFGGSGHDHLRFKGWYMYGGPDSPGGSDPRQVLRSKDL